ncbi:MAG: hypothetical protein CME21_16360 [Gemmatimonadetes bacterium]|nr:hypothetical protein [Gemmatimonadota bacterium]HCK09597.1 hypothetical protein [Candidatus Latescibacterota bacterium]
MALAFEFHDDPFGILMGVFLFDLVPSFRRISQRCFVAEVRAVRTNHAQYLSRNRLNADGVSER